LHSVVKLLPFMGKPLKSVCNEAESETRTQETGAGTGRDTKAEEKFDLHAVANK